MPIIPRMTLTEPSPFVAESYNLGAGNIRKVFSPVAPALRELAASCANLAHVPMLSPLDNVD
jgi:hypothetical protein